MYKYAIDDKNYLLYEKLNSFILVDFLYFDSLDTLAENIKNYFDYFSANTSEDFLSTYPGTHTPLVAKFHIDVIKSYGFDYRLYYDQQEIKDKQDFENTILADYVAKSYQFVFENGMQSACDGGLSKYCVEAGFKPCAVCSPLRDKTKKVLSPVKHYLVDAEGYLVKEYDEKPENESNIFSVMRISDKFKSKKIKVVDGRLQYFPK